MRKKVVFIMMVAGLLIVGVSQGSTPLKMAKGSQAGMYMAYGELAASGNFMDNVCLTSDGNGGWTSEALLLWKNRNDWAHFYCYAPYDTNIKSARAMYFTVKTDQTTAEAQAASDFYYGQANASPQQNGLPSLSLRHLLSKIVVKIVAGSGFQENELDNSDLSVRIKDVYTQAKIDLYEGQVNAAGQSANIKAYAEDELTFSAIVVPQRIANLSIVWKNTEYTLSFDRDCSSSKVYTLTATLKKTAAGIDISISDWEDSGEDFGGTVN